MTKIIIKNNNSDGSKEGSFLFMYVLLAIVLIVSISTIVFVGIDIKTKIDAEHAQNQNDKIEQILQEVDESGLNYPSKI